MSNAGRKAFVGRRKPIGNESSSPQGVDWKTPTVRRRVPSIAGDARVEPLPGLRDRPEFLTPPVADPPQPIGPSPVWIAVAPFRT